MKYASSRVTFTNASACNRPQVCLQFSKKKNQYSEFYIEKKGGNVFLLSYKQ